MAEHRPYAHIRADTWVCPYVGEDMPFGKSVDKLRTGLRANGKNF